LKPPSRKAAERRVEHDSGLRHRPFDTLEDRPAGTVGPATIALWLIHQERRRAEIKRLRLAPPRADLPVRDPRALRLLVLVSLVLCLIVVGPRSGHLILDSLVPRFGAASLTPPVEAWIKPPAYTGMAAILLKDDAGGTTVQVPTGSVLEAHVSDGSRVPRLSLNDLRVEFKPIEGGGFSLSQALTQSGTVSIRRGLSSLARWKIAIIPDHPPTVAFSERPSPMQSGALKIGYNATDDYGVVSVSFQARLAPGHPGIVAPPINIPLTSDQSLKDLRGVSFQDLTAHPWAGMPIVAKLTATDAAGQKGESEEIPMVLPQRVFLNPTARAIVEIRKHLIFNQMPHFQIALQIANIAQHPEMYDEDLSVFLALKAATVETRQIVRTGDDALLNVEDLLWNAALKIEDGDRPEAEKALRAAEDALEKALKDPNTPASEIARLTKALKDAMNRDIDAMAENLRKQEAQNGQKQEQPIDPNAQVMDRHDLDKQLDQMSQMAQQGSRDAAQDMLDYIKNLLENMRTARDPRAGEQAKKSLQDLKDLAEKQRGMENGNDPNAAEKQEALRQSLGDTARQIGETMGNIPQSMSAADKAMRNAAKALQRGTKGSAQGEQEEAAQQLDKAAETLSDQMSQQGGTELTNNGKGGGDRDPFGRSRFDKGQLVKVPTEREMQKSREILDELRKRASERERPGSELDYLRRLLQEY
ncbi:MAG: DUF4175 family protein, partial [Alphaproteobacteria bacterium]|nr:DUF4175 family protein [Alphaproteobacteria bacterium]